MTEDDARERLLEKIAAAQELQRAQGIRDFALAYRKVLRSRHEPFDSRANIPSEC
jgi:hypothetical protein